MAMAIHQNGKIKIGEWPNSKIGHSLRIWPFAYFGHSLVRTDVVPTIILLQSDKFLTKKNDFRIGNVLELKSNFVLK